MENYYEIIMKNGLSLIVFTNRSGFCEFSINGNAFSIFGSGSDENNEIVNLSVSAEKEVIPGMVQPEVLIEHEFTVLSIRRLNLKRLKGQKKTEIEKSKLLKRVDKESHSSCSSMGENYFCAYQGGIKTPEGWLFGSI